VTPVIPF
jgi:hypothetical protein